MFIVSALLTIILALIKFVLWLLATILFGIWWLQGRLLYMPDFDRRKGETRALSYNEEGYRSPADFDMQYEEVQLPCVDGVKLHCWLVKTDTDYTQAPTIIFFHGNAGNIGYRLPNVRKLQFLTASNVMMVEYRGYGNSEGSPDEMGLVWDSQAALDYLLARSDINHRRIVVFGRSLGGAVAISLASRNKESIHGVIVENTFTSIDAVATVLLERFQAPSKLTSSPSLRQFFRIFVTNHWNSIEKVGYLPMPLLFIAGLKDELIPPQHMRDLHAVAQAGDSAEATFYGIPHGTHNDTFVKGGAEYYERISKFLSKIS